MVAFSDPTCRSDRAFLFEDDGPEALPSRPVPTDAAQLRHRLVRYALLGTGVEQRRVMLIGAGRNGKTTIVNAIPNALGECAVSAEPCIHRERAQPASDQGVALRSPLASTSELNAGQ